MRFVHEFRDPARGREVARAIHAAAEPGRRYRLMEVCGGHTHAIYRFGLDQLLPPAVELLHGPGCPVCVMPMGRIDDAIGLARRPEVVLACFGDMLRVPGSEGSLLDARAAGADVRVVYSPLDALELAKRLPDREVVFYAIGFETTAPSTALTLRRARAAGVPNFSVLCCHVLIEPPLRALLESPGLDLDGFIGPGHVATVIGSDAFEFIPRDYGRPVVCAGFEPLDLLQAILMLVRRLNAGVADAANQYRRVVAGAGNPLALAALREVFCVRESFEWRGLGEILHSAYALAPAYADWDAEARFPLGATSVADPAACRCGDVLRGAIGPLECAAFGRDCTPEHPLGACMVSPEGACAAVHTYRPRVPA